MALCQEQIPVPHSGNHNKKSNIPELQHMERKLKWNRKKRENEIEGEGEVTERMVSW